MNMATLMRDYVALTKPRITWLILASTAIGFLFGVSPEGWNFVVLFHCLAGTGLLASGTAALNQWYERDADALMNRTKARPLPSGRVSSPGAFWFGIVLIAAGFVELWFGANPLTAGLGLFTVVSYLLAYTPLKRRTPHSTTIGAIPGAMPPLIGFAAAANTLGPEAWVLFAMLFLWQFPHFYAIAWMYREDYERAGIRMLPVVEPDGESTARRIFWTSIAMIPLSLVPKFLGMTGMIYAVGAVAASVAFAYVGWRLSSQLSRQGARSVLLASVVYLPVLYVLLIADRARL